MLSLSSGRTDNRNRVRGAPFVGHGGSVVTQLGSLLVTVSLTSRASHAAKKNPTVNSADSCMHTCLFESWSDGCSCPCRTPNASQTTASAADKPGTRDSRSEPELSIVLPGRSRSCKIYLISPPERRPSHPRTTPGASRSLTPVCSHQQGSDACAQPPASLTTAPVRRSRAGWVVSQPVPSCLPLSMWTRAASSFSAGLLPILAFSTTWLAPALSHAIHAIAPLQRRFVACEFLSTSYYLYCEDYFPELQRSASSRQPLSRARPRSLSRLVAPAHRHTYLRRNSICTLLCVFRVISYFSRLPPRSTRKSIFLE